MPTLHAHGAASEFEGDYFVDPAHPSAVDVPTGCELASSGIDPTRPWNSLSDAIARLLGAPRFRGGVRIWIKSSGTHSISSASARLIVRAYGSPESPIAIRGYWAAVKHAFGLFIMPFLNARIPGAPTIQDGTGSGEGIGLKIERTHDIEVQGLRIRGFRDGIQATGSRDIRIDGCVTDQNEVRGIALTPHDRTSTRDVEIRNCASFDNGVDSSGANIVFAALTANCSLRDSEIYSSSGERGVDGLTLDNTSTGHIIERNTFRDHIRATDGSDGNGIDLKATFQREGCDREWVVIRNNQFHGNLGPAIEIHKGCRGIQIYGNDIQGNAKGINIHPGRIRSEEDLVWEFRNPYCEGAGVAKGSLQSDIYVYRNIIANNRGHGVDIQLKRTGAMCEVKVDGEEHQSGCPPLFERTVFRNIQVLFNTIDGNDKYGVYVSRVLLDDEKGILMGTSGSSAIAPADVTFDFFLRRLEGIGIYGNILTRNGKAGSQHQLGVVGLVDSTSGGESDLGEVYIDHNFYRAHRTASSKEVAYLSTWTYSDSKAAFEITKNDDRARTVSELIAHGVHGGLGAPVPPDNPSPPRFRGSSWDSVPVSPLDYRLKSKSRAFPKPVGFKEGVLASIESSISVPLHFESGQPVPVAPDYRDKNWKKSRQSYGAFHCSHIGLP